MLSTLALNHNLSYNEEFSTYHECMFPNKNLPLDRILWYDDYNQQIRDPKYTYGYKIHTARYLRDKNYHNENSLIQFKRKNNQNLVPVEPTYIFEVFTPYNRDSSFNSK